MHVLSYGGIIWLKHEEMETNFKLGIKGLTRVTSKLNQLGWDMRKNCVPHYTNSCFELDENFMHLAMCIKPISSPGSMVRIE